jgi:hypothetical protein
VTVDDCRRDIDQLAVGVPCMFAQQREGAPLIDRVAPHENPFRTFGECAAPERALEVVVLRKTPQHDVDRALPILRLGVGDVGEDAALGRLFDESLP